MLPSARDVHDDIWIDIDRLFPPVRFDDTFFFPLSIRIENKPDGALSSSVTSTLSQGSSIGSGTGQTRRGSTHGTAIRARARNVFRTDIFTGRA